MAPQNARKKLPRTFLAGVRPPQLPHPAALYKEILDTLTSMDLKLDVEEEGKPALRGLAAMLTLGKYLAHAIAQAKASRNAVNEAVNELGKLVNTPQPWIADATVAAKRTVEALRIDPTLVEWWRETQRFVGKDLGISPINAKIDALKTTLDMPGPQGQVAAVEFAAGINGFAEWLLGPTKSIFFEIPGVDVFQLGGVRDVRRDELARWLAWQVSEHIYAVTESRRGGIKTALWVIEKVFPELGEGTAAEFKGRRHRCKEDSFATKAPLPVDNLQAIDLVRFVRLSERLEQLQSADTMA